MRRIVLGVLILLGAWILPACSTRYKAYDSGGGYYDFAIAENRYYVSFSGNGYTTQDEAYRMARYRAAELAHKKGFPFFSIVEENPDASRYDTHVGGSSGTDVEQPIVVLIVQFYSSRPEGKKVFRTDKIYP